MELTLKELCEQLAHIESTLRDDVCCNAYGRATLEAIIAQCAELRMRATRYGVGQ